MPPEAAAPRRTRTWLASGIVVLVVAGVAVAAVMASSTGRASTLTSRAYALPPHGSGADAAKRTEPDAGDLTSIPIELVTTTLVRGEGTPLRAGQSVTVNYAGWAFLTKQKFDSSWTRGAPFTFTLGTGQVIRGWDKGLLGVPVGSRVQIDMPAVYAYGYDGPVPGPLRFVIDVISAT